MAGKRFRNYLSALVVLVDGISLAISLYRLGTKGLWGDEVWEAMWSRQQGFVETFLRFRSPPDHPLHFLLTQISTTFSDSEFFVRLPSALLATGTAFWRYRAELHDAAIAAIRAAQPSASE